MRYVFDFFFGKPEVDEEVLDRTVLFRSSGDIRWIGLLPMTPM